jgi:xanthine dehydrogenase YagR molybdenum-binding subunit
MAITWPEKPRLLGTRVSRLDGPEKSTGRAKYSFDINRPGMLHAIILRCKYAHAKIKDIDISAAEKVPGFKALHYIKKNGDELYYAGDEILGIACDTEEHAKDAIRAVKIDYEELPFLVKEEDALKEDKATVAPLQNKRENVRIGQGGGQTNGVDDAFKKADKVVEGAYGVPVICHQCLESHGLVAEWDKDGNLTVWASTQAVVGTAGELSRYFSGKGIDLPENKVKCITHYMGGGFGSKFGPDIQGLVAAELARKAAAPVKLMLDRAEEITSAGNRPSAFGTVKIAGTKDGTITAYEVDSHGSPGVGGASTTVGPLPYVYFDAKRAGVFENRRKHTIIRLNAGAQRAMRAPGHPQSCYLTDCAIDDLAAALELDPMQVRLKNLPPNDPAAVQNNPQSINALRNTIYTKQITIAAEASKWKEKWHPPGQTKGPIKHGIGMALHTWGGSAQGQPNECTITIASDGSVAAQTSTQDLGTGQRTVTAVVTAEILGLEAKDILVKLGESPFGRSTGSGGSTTLPSQAPATLKAALAARDDFFKLIAPKLESKVEDLAIEAGKVTDKNRGKSWTWKEACARLGMMQAKGAGSWTAGEANAPETKNLSNQGVGGVQVAEVAVDTETGVVRCTQVVAVQDCGLIVSLKTCESQVAGGVIMGLNYALFEERIMDRHTGRQVNPDMEFYKLGGIKDMPKIIVRMVDMPERGVIGIGEPPTISTHAAIGNAIFNAIGVRVPYTPFTPDRVLAALANAKGGKA